MEPGLIVNADDLGIEPATTRGIASSYRNGIVSSASVIVTTPTVADAVTTANADKIPVGLHVALTQGRAIAGPRLSHLVDESGAFKLRAHELIRIRRKDTALIEQIRIEMRAQLARASDLGLTLTHVDSHQHVHMNPVLFPILEDEASAFGIRRIRFSREPLCFFWCAGRYGQILRRNNLPKWLVTRLYARQIKPRLESPDLFFGIFHSGVIVKHVLLKFLTAMPADKSVEICIHPGLPERTSSRSAREFEAFATSPFRRLEHDALIDAEVIDLVSKRGLVLRSFDGREKRR
jgi:predicted glycoside hydrolase/deacetylase ChbG (UPF0249 family)